MNVWQRILAALVLVLGVVLSPLRAVAATVPTFIAYDAAAGCTATTVLGRLDAVRGEAEHRSINARDPGRRSYDNASNPHVAAGAGAVHAYDDAPNRVERRELAGGLIYAAADPTTAAEGGEVAAQDAFNMTKTVADHAEDVVTRGPFKGELARPYVDSPLTVQEIMKAGPGVPDPQGVPGALRWDVPGAFRGSEGTWELVYDTNSNTILHFNFTGPR
jgi:hypothetical protein